MARRQQGNPWGTQNLSYQQRGFDSQGAAQSAQRGMGLVQHVDPTTGAKTYQKATMGDVSGLASRLGQGTNQTASTPYNLGGARWMFGQGGPQFTGQASDLAGGNAYNAATQIPYNPQKVGGNDARFKTPGLKADRTNVGYGGGNQPGRTPTGKQGMHGTRKQGPARQFPEKGTGLNQGPMGSPGAMAQGGMLGFPQTPSAPPSFLPMTPQYEAGRRSADDALMQQLQGIQNQQNMIGPMEQLQQQRLMTDQGYAGARLNEDLANRGLYESGVNPYLYQRDIAIPYGRGYQDLALNAGQQYGDLMGQAGGMYGTYGNAMTELLLNRAAQVAQEMPLSLPQFYPPKGKTSPRKSTSRRPRKTKSKSKGRPNRGK